MQQSEQPADVLDVEWHVYQMQLVSFLKAGRAGTYVVIHGEEILGFFEDNKSALQAGHDRYGLDPFLVKLVSSEEKPLYLPACGLPHVHYSF